MKASCADPAVLRKGTKQWNLRLATAPVCIREQSWTGIRSCCFSWWCP